MKKLLAAAALAATSVGAAQAADLPTRKAPPPPAIAYSPASVYSWDGFYAGSSIGYGWMDKFNAGAPIAFVPGGFIALSDPHGGVVVGPQVGFNYQVSPMFVAGLEADWQGSSVGGGRIGRRTPWFATLRGRLGVTPFDPRLMVYATGGFAFGQLRIGDFPLPVGGTISQTATGWALGGGVEYAFTDNWSTKVEYLYTKIGANFANPLVFGSSAQQRVGEHVVRIGLNYHFNAFGGGPVVARY